MTAMAGDAPGFEEALRALYAGDPARFHEESRRWPEDVRAHASALASDAFTVDADGPVASDAHDDA